MISHESKKNQDSEFPFARLRVYVEILPGFHVAPGQTEFEYKRYYSTIAPTPLTMVSTVTSGRDAKSAIFSIWCGYSITMVLVLVVVKGKRQHFQSVITRRASLRVCG
jgi:hypothetical protein